MRGVFNHNIDIHGETEKDTPKEDDALQTTTGKRPKQRERLYKGVTSLQYQDITLML